jgi:hypothetical protein
MHGGLSKDWRVLTTEEFSAADGQGEALWRSTGLALADGGDAMSADA